MIICMCKGVSDRTVRGLAVAGATTPQAVGRACGAGTCCGSCRATIRTILQESTSASPAFLVPSGE